MVQLGVTFSFMAVSQAEASTKKRRIISLEDTVQRPRRYGAVLPPRTGLTPVFGNSVFLPTSTPVVPVAPAAISTTSATPSLREQIRIDNRTAVRWALYGILFLELLAVTGLVRQRINHASRPDDHLVITAP